MNKGILFAFAAYGMWGFFPIYFKLIQAVPALQILAHRFVWSVVLLSILLAVTHEWKRFRAAITPKIIFTYAIAACLLALNWYTYIWAVNAGLILEASLGYFINPLVNVLLGVVFLKERLRISQWIPIGLAGVGVLYMTFAYGALPWVALTLAFTFGMYGLMKKISPLNSLHGLSLETAVLFIPAAGYLLLAEAQGGAAFGHSGVVPTALLVFTGVITVVPLLLFAGAAHRIPLTTLGLVQYITPTLQFLIGVLLYHEPFTHDRVIGFSIIWLALAIYTVINFLQRSKLFAVPISQREKPVSSQE